jgi:hypothetical protein
MPQKITTGVFGSATRDEPVINANADELQRVEDDVSAVQATVGKQAAELQELRVVVMALRQILVEKGASTGAELDDAIEELSRPPPPPPALGNDPYRTAAATPAPEPTVTCIVCNLAVPTSSTVITAKGTVCDSCFDR